MSEQEGVAGVTLREAARGVLPEVIDVDFPSVITSPDSFTASIERMTGIADRWQALRAALSPTPEAAPGATYTPGDNVARVLHGMGMPYSEANPAPRSLDAAWAALERILEFRPKANFDYIDPRGEDLLMAVAAWMDKLDALNGDPKHDVQRDLRRWAKEMRAARALTAKLRERPA